MKTNLRGLLATMFATGLLAACSSDGGNTTPPADAGTDIGTSDIGTADVPRTDGSTDRPATDVQRVDAGNLVAEVCGAAVDLSSMTPGSDGAIHVMGDNSDAPAVQIGNLGLAAEGGCLGATSGGDGSKGATVAFRYTTRTAGILTASTANDGTDFDTVVAILPTCTANATPLACNDDSAGELTSTARTSTALTAGQTVFIVVGGWGANPKGALTGAFELTVRESPPIAIGMPCPLGQVCAAGSICVGASAMNSGVCTADGSAPGAACRTAAPFCDGAFSCSVATPSMAARGICRRTVAIGEACSATAVCGSMGFCPNFTSVMPVGGDAGVPADAGAPTAMRYCAAPVMEAEPNNTPAAPQAAVTTTTVFRGALATGADVDCYAVTVPAGTTLYAETSGADGTCSLADGEDTVVNIYSQGVAAPIATNDDIAMGNVCSRISGTTAVTRVPAGTYSVCVSSYLMMGEGTPIAAYYLTVGLTN
jgi:hypothetical protein